MKHEARNTKHESRKKLKTVTLPLLVSFMFLVSLFTIHQPMAGFAQDNPQDQACDAIVDVTGLDCNDETDSSLQEFLTDLTNPILEILVAIGLAGAVLMIIVGGAKYVTSGGAPDKIESAKKTITFAVIGLLILLLAELFLRGVFSAAEELKNGISCPDQTQSSADNSECVPIVQPNQGGPQ